MRLACLLLCAAALAQAGCSWGGSRDRIARADDAASGWRRIATEDDRARLRQWRSAWVRGLRQAEAAGHGAALAREGPLVQPDAAIDWRDPPPGDYRCRTIKIGARTRGMLDYIAYPPFTCRVRVENGALSLAKLTGSQRPIGLILPDTARRSVFLGTLQLGDERRALHYGRDRDRDMAGLAERIGESRWRIAFPLPHFESTLDVLELVPS